ncbi:MULTISPECIES: ATP-binding protein [unclassified Sphingobium]|uniref:ATP-binding protein n=1 Tax=unclassified Sphingobium TaxID=2611147 RepID=UPI000D15D05E|nr:MULTISPECIES: ATP-binding protein [unclassified Sphingobium]MBG6119019.1 hypothetical protein [Sphingobium sp. JAI105]TWC96274.1 IstB-like ATP binding protein [Sphingobium sp. AEW010]TWD16110.1 IstB-like ATP binding protein [Sphingobium sp. AEW013]TWD19200.1 IstB-like ATP binding protein [Sphingobium sp. AEW001]
MARHGGKNIFVQLVNGRYEKGAIILTSNQALPNGAISLATALLERLLHHPVVMQIEGASYRMRQQADLLPEHARAAPSINPPPFSKMRGRPPP